MDYKKKVEDLLKEYMTEKSFKLWSGINSRLPDIWNNPTSSTGKYHKKQNGDIPVQAEHVYHMLFATIKISRLFGIELKTTNCDKLLFAVALHDSLKYGQLGTRKFTDSKHDKNAGDMVSENKETFEKILTTDQFFVMEEAIRFHSGQWSTDVPKNKTFKFNDYNPETLFIHILDMMSTADLIQTDMRE